LSDGSRVGGFIAQTLALQQPARTNKLILLSADPGGADADLDSAELWSQLVDMSGTPHEQARRLLSLLFPGDIAAVTRAAISEPRYSPGRGDGRVAPHWHRETPARDKRARANCDWHSRHPVIPPSNALKLVNGIPSAWLAQFNGGGHAFMAQFQVRLPTLSIAFSSLSQQSAETQRVQAFQRLRIGFA
jgi:pimeloyl-ACP methyl ester carboxylesterase